jgi:hypothetical protein
MVYLFSRVRSSGNGKKNRKVAERDYLPSTIDSPTTSLRPEGIPTDIHVLTRQAYAFRL